MVPVRAAATFLFLVGGTAAVPASPESTEKSVAPLVLQATNPLVLHQEPETVDTPYDWGPVVMRDGPLYRMWWVRWGGEGKHRFPYVASLPDGATWSFTYPDRGDRIYYAESRDGRTWHLDGPEFSGPPETYGPDAPGPLIALSPAETSMERMHLGTPAVIKVAGVFYMYYEAASDFVAVRDASGEPQVLGEYHNRVFLATSSDGRVWRKYPTDDAPAPIVDTADTNHRPGEQRYGRGQPSVYFRDGLFVLYYVHSHDCPLDFVIRLEADNPWFRNARVFPRTLQPQVVTGCVPAGACARFAQMDVKYLGEWIYLLRPAYGTGNLGLLASADGFFESDADLVHPRDAYPQVLTHDPRGPNYLERLFPRFLIEPEGEIAVEGDHVVLFYGSGRGWKELAYTWDLQRSDLPLAELQRVRP